MRPKLKLALRELLARLGSIFIWVGLWDILIQIVKEENYLGNILFILIGCVLWGITGELTQGTVAQRISDITQFSEQKQDPI